MITLVLHLLRLLPFLVGGHRQLALENLALRQQLAVYKRLAPRPKLHTTDRLFWALLPRFWTGWKQALVIVTPDTVLRWQRRRFRQYWTRLSGASAAAAHRSVRRSPYSSGRWPRRIPYVLGGLGARIGDPHTLCFLGLILDGYDIEVWEYASGAHVDTSTALNRGMLSIATFAAAEQEAARKRTRETMRDKATGGHVAGGKVFGYRNVRDGSHVRREIVEAEADVIRRIFREIAEDRGYARIAQGLNADAVPCPKGHRWAMAGVREMVYRPLYRGRIVYGKKRNQYRRGRKVKVRVPESEWITVEAPTLRIISEEAWQAAHERIDQTWQAYLRTTGGKLYGRPETGVESKYLLSGFLVCGACGGGMHVIRRSSQRGRRALYFACNNWRVNHACVNSMSIHTGALDAVILATIKADVLTEEIVEAVVTRTIELARLEPDEHAERRQGLTSEARRLAEEIARITEAIATGGPLAALLEALKGRERQRVDALARLEHLDGLSRAPEWGDGIRDKLRARLTEWQGFLGRQPEIARQILRKLPVGRLVLTPDSTARTYTVQGRATYGQLLEGIIRVGGLVPPERSGRDHTLTVRGLIRAA